MADLLRLDEAQRLILERVPRLDVETVGVADAADRVLAEAALARVDLPPFPSSAMDGFAVRSRDTPGTFPVVFRIAAGRPAERPLAAAEAMAIATGAVVPEGADAVVPIEDVFTLDNNVRVPEAAAGANVRPVGGDTRAGDLVADAGMRLAPAQLGALAAAGIAEVRCARRPRAAVLATGTELQTPGHPLAPGQVYEANSVMLTAQLEAAGALVKRLVRVEDDEGAHRDALAEGLAADVVVTSGGVSVGPHDLVRAAGRELGVEEVFWGVAVKPGKPLSFGVRGATLVFGLPGNPVSALVGFELFVRPAVLALQGLGDPLPAFRSGTLSRAVPRNPHRDELVRARSLREDGALLLEPVTGQESHMIVRAASADTLVLVEKGDGELEAGSPVQYLPLC
ncbi:MAG: molybdopterin molybdotransferase MoeA [Actinomycetota bacterium]|nr:molybdopterin molybdotransferase MoeA [Actinomycetota bacterium]